MEAEEIHKRIKAQVEDALKLVEAMKEAMSPEDAEKLREELKKEHQNFELPNFSFGQAMEFLKTMKK
jgi:uncharacterized coiled-coil DUF342 family protein